MVVSALTAFAVSLAVQPLLIRLLVRRAVLDLPSSRSNHLVATPRGGGLAVLLAVLLGVAVVGDSLAVSLTVGVVLAAAVGLVEDVRGVPVGLRLCLLALAAVATALTVAGAGLVPPGRAALVLAVLAVPWTLAVVNAVNFMDGINGISVAQATVGGAAYAALGTYAEVGAMTTWGAALVGAALGFAPYNVPRARVFLGDVGSYGLGAAMAALAVVGLAAGLPVEAVAGPVALYGADTLTTLVRRRRAGAPWHVPHRDHVYQRLVLAGWSHVRVSSLVAVLTAVVSALSAVSVVASWPLRLAADVAAVAVAVAYLATPRLLQRQRRAAQPGWVST